MDTAMFLVNVVMILLAVAFITGYVARERFGFLLVWAAILIANIVMAYFNGLEVFA